MIVHSRVSSVFRPGPQARVAAALVALVWAGRPGTTLMAQGTTPDSRVAVSLVGGYRATENTFAQSVAFEQYSEPGSLTANYTARRRPTTDAGLTLRVWRTLGVGISGSYYRDLGSAEVRALVPHPLTFNQPRGISGRADVSHRDIGMHLQAVYWTQASRRMEMLLYGGPSVFRVEQDFVSDIAFSEAEPYDTATYQGATVIRQHKSVTGGNIGGEIGWRLARHLGLTAAARFSRATAAFAGTSAAPVVVGGFHFGAGLRILF